MSFLQRRIRHVQGMSDKKPYPASVISWKITLIIDWDVLISVFLSWMLQKICHCCYWHKCHKRCVISTLVMTIFRTDTVISSLRPSDAIWWHRSGSTLAQVMACCLTAPSHYLNQCWLKSSVRSCCIHLRAISYLIPEIPQPPFTKISFKLPS